jgi:hypothetical protein
MSKNSISASDHNLAAPWGGDNTKIEESHEVLCAERRAAVEQHAKTKGGHDAEAPEQAPDFWICAARRP